nr:hypothetical protein [uncultured Mediterranean phage uvMED]
MVAAAIGARQRPVRSKGPPVRHEKPPKKLAQRAAPLAVISAYHPHMRT